MIDIYTRGGAFYGATITYEGMKNIMEDGFIKPHHFIEFSFKDGTKGSVLKRTIEGYVEHIEGAEVE